MRPNPADLGRNSVLEHILYNRLPGPIADSWSGFGVFISGLRLLQLAISATVLGLLAYAISLQIPAVAGAYVTALACICLTLILLLANVLIFLPDNRLLFERVKWAQGFGYAFDGFAVLLWLAAWLALNYSRSHMKCDVVKECALQNACLGLSIVAFAFGCLLVLHDNNKWIRQRLRLNLKADQEAYEREAAENREYIGMPVGRVVSNPRSSAVHGKQQGSA